MDFLNCYCYLCSKTYTKTKPVDECSQMDLPAVDEFVNVQGGPAVGTLGPLLRQPPPDAEVAAQLGAVRAQVGISKSLHTDEATEHVG